MNKKILIIEDDPVVGHIYRMRLEKEGYEIQICVDGQSGFYSIHEFRPDAVLLDLMLPKMNGVEILKKIRAQSQFQKTPIVVFTNAYVPNMIHESFQAGATQVFNKATLTPRQIIEALNNALCTVSRSALSSSPTAVPTQRLAQAQASAGTISDPTTLGEPPFHAPTAVAAAPTACVAPPDATFPEPASPVLPPPPPSSQPLAPANILPEFQTPRFDDDEFQAELLRNFLATTPEQLASLRKVMQEFSKAHEEADRLPPLLEVYRKVHALTSNAGLVGLNCIAQIAAALEILLKELYEKPKNINASTLRTVAHSIDFIAELLGLGQDAQMLESPPINILVVDDEILSRRAITYALEKAGLKSVSVEEPQVALDLATENTFDLIFLDVQMPGMDGFDLCTRIRALPTNKDTPVIFVTSLTDFKSRARSTLSGGTDLIAKPFMFIELSVKALTYVMRGRLSRFRSRITATAA